MLTRPLAAILLAAGKGTRMRSELPKVLHPVLGEPLVAHPLARVLELGARPSVLVIGHGAGLVRRAFAQYGEEVTFALQAEQLGTGHATLCAHPALQDFHGDVLIIPGDVPLIQTATLQRFLRLHREQGSVLTVLTMVFPENTPYGRIVRDTDGSVLRIVEARDADEATLAIREVNSGIYMVDADFLFSALARIGNQNAQREYYLTDIVAIARADKRAPQACILEDAGEVQGVNDRYELSQVESRLQERVSRRFMQAGVTFQAPATIRVETTVRLEADVLLAPGVQLLGTTVVGAGARVGAGAVLRDVQVGARATIGAGSVLTRVQVAAGACLAPLSCLEATDEASHD